MPRVAVEALTVALNYYRQTPGFVTCTAGDV
jgi:hypothetical protein